MTHNRRMHPQPSSAPSSSSIDVDRRGQARRSRRHDPPYLQYVTELAAVHIPNRENRKKKGEQRVRSKESTNAMRVFLGFVHEHRRVLNVVFLQGARGATFPNRRFNRPCGEGKHRTSLPFPSAPAPPISPQPPHPPPSFPCRRGEEGGGGRGEGKEGVEGEGKECLWHPHPPPPPP